MFCSFLKDTGLTLSMPAVVAGGRKYPDADLPSAERGEASYSMPKHRGKELALLVASLSKLLTCTEG